MLTKPDTCHGCPLELIGQGFMRPTGNGDNGVLLCAEALGAHEAAHGVPLIGMAGFTLGRALQRGKMKRDHFTLANVVWCQPPGNDLRGMPYEAAAIAHCTPYLSRLIAELQPTYPRRVDYPPVMDGERLKEPARHYRPNELVVAALGEVPLRRFTDYAGITDCRGYVFWSAEFNCWVVPTYHPSFIQRGNHNLMGTIIEDIQRALWIAEEGFSYEQIDPLLDPDVATFNGWIDRYVAALAADPGLPLAVDIETPRKRGRSEDDLAGDDDPTYTILRIGFAFGPDGARGVSLPWVPELLPGVRRLLGRAGRKIIWFRPYDLPRLLAHGLHIGGVVEDAMDAWHTFQSDVPRGIGFVTPRYCPRIPMWKHLSGSAPSFYNAMDAITLWRNYVGILADLERT